MVRLIWKIPASLAREFDYQGHHIVILFPLKQFPESPAQARVHTSLVTDRTHGFPQLQGSRDCGVSAGRAACLNKRGQLAVSPTVLRACDI